MSKTQNHNVIAAAREIAGEIREVENQMDRALAGKARLLATMLDKRIEAGLPARAAHKALAHGFDAVSLARQARDEMLAMHAELAGFDIRASTYGDVLECPKFAELKVVEGDLSAAA